MDGNDVFFTDETIFLNYFDFKISLRRKWFCTCGINDFKKCMKTLEWACSDDAARFRTVIDCIERTLKYSYPMVKLRAFDKKTKVLNKYRKEYSNYEF